ncbi:MAG: glycosyltransferase family 2 protein [Burkholderiales bacterium]|nr:glycosyltransferase family 2 protein [Burkholderiales bacterium]
MKIVAIVMTFNEEIHIKRCLEKLQGIATDILLIDSFSTDKTVEIANSLGAKVLQNTWVNYSQQFQYGMQNLPADTDWVMRIDADEYLSDDFAIDIKEKLSSLSTDITGIYCSLRRVFLGKIIQHGAVNIKMLRLWRHGYGKMETRWMDEHIQLTGNTATFRGYIIDHNLNSLTWWVNKHNNYSSREVVDILNKKYGLITTSGLSMKAPFGVKRFIKENIYNKLPCGIRAFFYFCFRYIFAGGFLDGFAGLAFHFLQGFWYRFLVDAKLYEVEMYKKVNNESIAISIEKVLGIKL